MLKRMALSGAFAIAVVGAVASQAAVAQTDYPSRPVRVLVAYPPGGFPDTTARLYSDQLGKIFHQSFIVENKPSSGTIIAGEAVAHAAPDGYTLLAADSQMWAIAPLMYKLPFDPMKDFEPISMLSENSNYLSISPKSPIPPNLPDAIKFLKAHPSQFHYGSAGIGSFHHLLMEVFQAKTGIKLVHVPFKGTAQILPALSEGEIAIANHSLASVASYLAQGKIKMIGIIAAKRSASYPDVPTMQEGGVSGMDIPGTMALFAPKGTPRPIIDRLGQAIKTAIGEPDLRQRMDSLSVTPIGTSPEETTAAMKADFTAFSAVAKDANLKPE